MGVPKKLLDWKGGMWCALSVLGHVCGAGRFSLLPCAYVIAAAATDSGIAECSGGSGCNGKWAASGCKFVSAKYNAAATPCAAAASSRAELGRSVWVMLELIPDHWTLNVLLVVRKLLESCTFFKECDILQLNQVIKASRFHILTLHHIGFILLNFRAIVLSLSTGETHLRYWFWTKAIVQTQFYKI